MRTVPSSEFELLLLCSRSSIEEDRILHLLGRSPDRCRFALLARRHGLTPMVSRTLRAMNSNQAAGEICEMLRPEVESIRFQNLVLLRELLNILRAFEAEGITVTPYKGAALSEFLFHEPTLRRVADIDVLVRPGDALRARAILLKLGFLPKRKVSRRAQAAFVRIHNEFTFTGLEGTLTVELHWRIAPLYWCLPEISESVWKRMGRMRLIDVEVPWLATEDLLVVLCAHGCTHKWKALKWVVDIAELIRISNENDLGLALEEARRIGCWRMVALGMLLAANLFEAPLESGLLADIRSDPSVGRLAEEISTDYLAASAQGLGMSEKLRFMARAADRFGAKLMFHLLIPAYLLHHRAGSPRADEAN